MSNEENYLSEFESEFEQYDGEMNASDEYQDEFENDFSGESDEEVDAHGEYELNDEYELDDHETNDEYEFEGEQSDSEAENYLQEYSSPDQEFEDRIYTALSGEYESSFEMEQEIDRVLYEMEVEYFWKSAKKLWNKHKNKIMPLAKNFIPGGSLASLAKFAGGDLRNLLKSDFVKKGLTMAANAYLPGVGGVVAGRLLNREMPAGNARVQAAQTVQIAKNAYQNMAKLMPGLRSGNVPGQISRFSRQALTAAKNRHSGYKGKNKKVIRIKPNSTVVVRSDRIIIYS